MALTDRYPNIKYFGVWVWLSIFSLSICAGIIACGKEAIIKNQFDLSVYIPVQIILLVYMLLLVISFVSIAMWIFKMIVGEENEDKKIIKNVTTLYDVFYVSSGLLAAIIFFVIDTTRAAGIKNFFSNSLLLKSALLIPFSFRFAKALIDRRYR
ncbi:MULTISPECIES: hypothetical protein [Asaia]|nr:MULTISPECIES: hypothetical protein [Asaia]ETC97762.1 hypothetical protein P792_13535 [Asaia sp. SF2.1]